MTLLVWLNFPLCAAIFLAVTGIPLWLVVKRPEWGSDPGWPADPGSTSSRVPAQGRARHMSPARDEDRSPARSHIGAAR
jgi:hypothetical protein